MPAWMQVRVIRLKRLLLVSGTKITCRGGLVRERRAKIVEYNYNLPFIILKIWILRQYIKPEIETLN